MIRHAARRRDSSSRSVIAGLDVPAPFDLTEFCRRIEVRRGKRLVLSSLPPQSNSGICGLYLETSTTDLVFYAAESKTLHRDHVIVHELMHLLLGHGAVSTGPGLSVDASELLKDLGVGLVHRVLFRSGYLTPDEQEAETLASMIMRGVPAQASSASGRLEELLG